MFVIVFFTIQEFFNGRVERCETSLLLEIREVNRLVSTRRSNIEFRIENIDARNNSAQPGKAKRNMTFVLSRLLFAAKTNTYNPKE